MCLSFLETKAHYVVTYSTVSNDIFQQIMAEKVWWQDLVSVYPLWSFVQLLLLLLSTSSGKYVQWTLS